MFTESSLCTINKSIFRTYDIRGIVGEGLTEESVFLMGKALGSLVRDLGDNQMAVARDGRLSSPILVKSLCAGIQASGCDVQYIGMGPTPLLYFATNLFDQHSGVMLTGSHNPADYNGLKMVVQGTTLSEDGIKDLYQRIVENRFHNGNGSYKECNIEHYYIETVINNIQLERPLRIVIDAGNGATGEIAPKLFKALGCEVHELFCEVDGRFPNHHPDPCQEENLQDLIRVVREKKADVGLAFDGDGDRLGVVTSQGEVVAADRLMMLFAKTLLAEQPAAKIIFDVKCSDNLAKIIEEKGGVPIMWKTGHSLIKAKLAEFEAQLAGEMSGHLFFKDRWYGFDDALYAGARLLEIISKEQDSEKSFSSLPKSCITPELKIAVADEEKFLCMRKLKECAQFNDALDINTIDGLRVTFADGWGLIRPSNTTPCLILRFEAVDQSALAKIQEKFRDWILSVKPSLKLPF